MTLLSLKPWTKQLNALYLIPITSFTLISLIIGLGAEPFYQFAVLAAEQLLNPTRYVEAVLGRVT
ncbi:Na(+) H(+) antiporter subunit D [Vibrio ishigakensis]|uniref:Na(+) H(+) antiporter subunit D n=1 Tax=Vibrio ishigakensis TaxID=1481914 RepID=A0A0B8P7W7_9VIBR|nr:Na(+) H(+) antiporter subunit D [Vibrio ishigakensis]